MNQLSLWERTNVAIDSYFQVASEKASTLPRAHATQKRRAAPARRGQAGLVGRFHEVLETMTDRERYGDREPPIDPQTGYYDE